MHQEVITLFVSAVTNEFGALRRKLRRAFDQPGVINVISQENMVRTGTDTLLKIDDHIHKLCKLVLHVVGDQTGGLPARNEVRDLLKRYPKLMSDCNLKRHELDNLTRTQWEAWLAVYHEIDLYIAIPSTKRRRGKRATNVADAMGQRQRQTEHLARLSQHVHKDRLPFSFYSYATLSNQLHQSLHLMQVKRTKEAVQVASTATNAGLAVQRTAYEWPKPLSIAADRTGIRFVGRAWLFQRIDAWVGNNNALPLLLLGGFGTGKTASMLELARRLSDSRVILHCCQFNHDETLLPGRVVMNIAFQLCALIPEYKEAIESDLHLRGLLDQADENPSLALKDAVFAPLERLGAEKCGRCFLIIDGLDESLEIGPAPGQSPSRSATLVDVVVEARIMVPKWFHVVISSRPISAIRRDGVRRNFTIIEFEHDGEPYKDEDIASYVLTRVSGDPGIQKFLHTAGRTASDLAKKLSTISEGRFLLMKYVLDDIQSGHIVPSKFDELPVWVGSFYESALTRRVARANLDQAKVRELFGIIAVARMPIPPKALSQILPSMTNQGVMAIFEALGGLLVSDERGGINFAHFSFEEWLDDQNGPNVLTPSDYRIDREDAESLLLDYCKKMSTLSLENTGEFRAYLESYGIRLLVEKEEFACALNLLASMRRGLAKLPAWEPEHEISIPDRTTLAQRCAKQTVLVTDRIRAYWKQMDKAAGETRQRMCQRLAKIEPDFLENMLYGKDYETGKYVPIIRVLIEFQGEAWKAIKAKLLEMPDENDIVFRYDTGVAYAQAWHAAKEPEKHTLLSELSTMARDNEASDLREMAGYAFTYICERTDRKTWWMPILPTIKALAIEFARSENQTDRRMAGEMLLALAIQGENVTKWFADVPGHPPFWETYWPNQRADISAIRTLLGEVGPTEVGADDSPESVTSCSALHDRALKMGEGLRHAPFFCNNPVGMQFAGLLSGNVAQQGRAEVFDHIAVRELAKALHGPDSGDVVMFIRYLMLHPNWNAIERAASLVSDLVRRDPELDFVIEELSHASPAEWRIRYGAVDAAYNCGGRDKYERFFKLLIRYREDRSCRLRGICIDDLNGWIRDADGPELDERLRKPDLVGLIRLWLETADDIWLLEYLHEMFHDLQEIHYWNHARIAELMGPSANRLSRYITDAHFYELAAEDFMAQCERLRYTEWEARPASAV
jgi:hypothetical protein